MNARVRNWAAVWAGWTALALFFAVSASLTYRSTGRPANWSVSIQRSLAEWWLWALLTPVIVWLARRFPLDRKWPWRNAIVHAASGAAIAVVKTAADRVVFAWLTGFWMYWLISTLALQWFVYLAAVAAVHGVGFHQRSRERDQLERRLADARLQLLSMQLQPHFLFNTLNTIAEMVHDDPEAADRMITGLSDLLRRSLDLGATQEIPLDGELDLLSCYLDIQKARFGDRLSVNIAVDPNARAAAVPVLLFQPLVENAIRHGLAQRVASGRIDVSVDRVGDTLVITVADDGPGAAAQVDGRRERVGVGLGNTRARLDALYGARHRLALSREPQSGARVRLEIPFRSLAAPS